MAKKNSADSEVNIVTSTFIRREGRLIEETPSVIIFKYRKSGGRRMIQEGFARADVAAYSDDVIIVKQHTKLPRQIFRPMTGAVSVDTKTGWYDVDGVRLNPAYAQIQADLGVEDDGEKKSSKKATKKKG